MSLKIAPATPDAVPALLDQLAALRIRVFHDWPYLYDGDLDYEARYLASYADSPGAIVVLAQAEGRVVGAATGAPLGDHDDAFATPLVQAGFDPAQTFYHGESVLLPAYRGQGAGHAFFDHREAHARRLGMTHAAFCAVIRSADHPDRPMDYTPLDPFWRSRGYAPLPGAIARYAWRDRGDAGETEKPMQAWIKDL